MAMAQIHDMALQAKRGEAVVLVLPDFHMIRLFMEEYGERYAAHISEPYTIRHYYEGASNIKVITPRNLNQLRGLNISGLVMDNVDMMRPVFVSEVLHHTPDARIFLTGTDDDDNPTVKMLLNWRSHG